MTDPKENEEINEELSVDELKSVSGGAAFIKGEQLTVQQRDPFDPQGSGSGMSKADFERANKTGFSSADVLTQSGTSDHGATM